jgi:hypothetical protein
MKILIFRLSKSYREPHRSPSLPRGQMLLGKTNPLGRHVDLHTLQHCHVHTVLIDECSPVYATRVDAESQVSDNQCIRFNYSFPLMH